MALCVTHASLDIFVNSNTSEDIGLRSAHTTISHSYYRIGLLYLIRNWLLLRLRSTNRSHVGHLKSQNEVLNSSVVKAEALNYQFVSIYSDPTNPRSAVEFTFTPIVTSDMPFITVTSSGVLNLSSKIKLSTALFLMAQVSEC